MTFYVTMKVEMVKFNKFIAEIFNARWEILYL